MEPSPGLARLGLGSLWLGHFLRVLAENVVRYHIISEIVRRKVDAGRSFAAGLENVLIAAMVGALVGPYLALAPGRPVWVRRFLPLIAMSGAVVALLALGLPGTLDPVYLFGGLCGLSAAYVSCRHVSLPWLCRAAGVRLIRGRGVVGLLTAAATVGGLSLGAELALRQAAWWSAGLFGLAGLAMLPLTLRRAAGDAGEPKIEGDGLDDYPQGVPDGAVRIAAAGHLLLPCVGLILAAVVGSFTTADGLWTYAGQAGWFFLGAAVACVQAHPHRAQGMVPVGLLVAVPFAVYAASVGDWHLPGMWLSLGVALGGLGNAFQATASANQRAGVTVLGAYVAFLTLVFTYALPGPAAWFRAALPSAALLIILIVYRRPLLEQIAEVLLWFPYHIRGHGHGLNRFPQTGPVLVVANHSAWFDPVWLGKVLPRGITPMMTSRFFDLPVLSFLMKRVFYVIRVPEVNFRREAPELQTAIGRLDNGECVIIFPQGYLQRTDDRPIRRFAQGVWHILAARPDTPVALCWIEGSWGSYTSYYGGPPAKNKKLDFRRKIDIAVTEPRPLDPEVLKDQVATRTTLMRDVLQARTLLGLPALESGLPGVDPKPEGQDE